MTEFGFLGAEKPLLRSTLLTHRSAYPQRSPDMPELDPKQDRTVVISGAGTGIGQATAVKFGRLGWRVAVGGRRPEPLAETSSLVEAAGGTCFAHVLDVTDASSVEEFFNATESEFGPVNAVINNAALGSYYPLAEFPPEQIEREVATKLLGSLYMARRGIQSMQPDGRGGDVLFVTSLAAVQPWPRHLPYAAASAGVEQAARTLRLELEGSGIRVTILRCGETAGTEFGTSEYESGRGAAASELWFRSGLLPHNGLMTPDMVADTIVHAITLPREYQFDTLAAIPMAPIGEVPTTFAEWGEAMMRLYSPD
jgi:NAD(P)-dependent dehydrogenase (short-subunit alcohol dehydrogenase family)